MPGQHAKFSPSGSKRWIKCAGSLVLEEAFPNIANDFSDDGTACHAVAAICLEDNDAPEKWLDLPVIVDESDPPRTVVFTEDLAEMTASYVETIQALRKNAVLCWIEWRGDFSHVIGIPDQAGTADCVMLFRLEDGTYELFICDLKTGWRYVEVENNSQLMLYALAALAALEMAYDITRIRLGIFAPRHGGLSEWTCPVEDLRAFGRQAWDAAALAELARTKYRPAEFTIADADDWCKRFLHPDPNEEDCAFCRAMATCPAAQAKVKVSLSVDDFDVILEHAAVGIDPVKQLAAEIEEADALGADVGGYLGKLMAATGFIEDWIKAVRAEVERRLLRGEKITGYGLELGRSGARAWKDKQAAEDYLRKTVRLRLEDACDVAVKSPTSVEKLTKAKKGETPLLTQRQWGKLQDNIQRSEPKPSVRPLSVIKEPYTVNPPTDDGMDAVPEEIL